MIELRLELDPIEIDTLDNYHTRNNHTGKQLALKDFGLSKIPGGVYVNDGKKFERTLDKEMLFTSLNKDTTFLIKSVKNRKGYVVFTNYILNTIFNKYRIKKELVKLLKKLNEKD